MFEMWVDAVSGAIWGLWLALYLDRFYARQVAAINLCVFVFWGRSFKANRMLAATLNLFLLVGFLLAASALIGKLVSSWVVFVACWCAGYALYSFYFSLRKPASAKMPDL